MNGTGVKLFSDAGFTDNQIGHVLRSKSFKRMHHLGMRAAYSNRTASKRLGIV